MQNKAIMYAKLARVYAKGMGGLRRRVYDLQFVYVPEDKLWYIDMPWPGDRYNLAMVAGSNHLLKFLDYKGGRRVRVLVMPSKSLRPELESEDYFMCGLLGNFVNNCYTRICAIYSKLKGTKKCIRAKW